MSDVARAGSARVGRVARRRTTAARSRPVPRQTLDLAFGLAVLWAIPATAFVAILLLFT